MAKRPEGHAYLYHGENAYSGGSKFTMGMFNDLQEMGVTPAVGLSLKFYDFDEDDQGRPAWLYFEGVIKYDAQHDQWSAKVDDDSFHWIPATDASA